MLLLEREDRALVVVFLHSVYVVLALIVLIQAAGRRDPERDGPSHSTLLSLFYFSHVAGRGKEGTVLFQNQIQTPLLIVTQTDTKHPHLFSSVSTVSFSAVFAKEKHHN